MTTITIQEAQAQLEEIIHRLAPGDEAGHLERIVKTQSVCREVALKNGFSPPAFHASGTLVFESTQSDVPLNGCLLGSCILRTSPGTNPEPMNTISMSTDSAFTPNYVLLHGKTRLAPTVLPLRSGKKCSALYGFSDKAPYDLFRSNSELALTPFPLVKVYLRTLIEAGSETLHLVILDATSPSDVSVRAASMEAVLEAQLAQTAIVHAEYSLTLDKEANGYRVDESS